ncbi:hypothetical protein GCM10010199_07800 [Dactylosporangium roseum]
MGVVIVLRPPGRAAPSLPTGELVLGPPPEPPIPSCRGWLRVLTVLPMAAGAAATGLMLGVGVQLAGTPPVE